MFHWTDTEKWSETEKGEIAAMFMATEQQMFNIQYIMRNKTIIATKAKPPEKTKFP